MPSFFKSKNFKKSQEPTTGLPPEPLSELFLVAPGIARMGGYLNTGRSLNFYAYKNEPPLFNLDISTGTLLAILRTGSDTKGQEIAWAEESDTAGEFKVVQGEDKMKSKLERIAKDDYRWTISSPQWALKGAATDEEATLCDVEKTFQWLRVSRQEGRQAGFGNPDWKLVDRTTGEVHAVFVERWDGSSDRGEVQFRRSWGREWEMGVLVTIGVVEEKERVRRLNAGSFSRGFFNSGLAFV